MKFSVNHSSIGTRTSGSASPEATEAFEECVATGGRLHHQFEEWLSTTPTVGAEFPPHSVVYMARVE